MQNVCTIQCNLSALKSTAKTFTGFDGVVYQRVCYDIVLWFGGSELKAQFRWLENVNPIMFLKILNANTTSL